jgi:hypothetical protein
MKAFSPVALFAALVLAACGSSSDENAHVQTLPNSLADTASAHVAQREIPSYGPKTLGLPDTSRSTRAQGQVLYAPVYSHIFHRSADREMTLTATLSVRNTSSERSLEIRRVDYFDSEGTLLNAYLDGSRPLGPLASTYVVIEGENVSGGVGANFIVEWEASRAVTPPVVETVMISTESTQGISLTSRARVIEEW